jgi:hypothetical protein
MASDTEVRAPDAGGLDARALDNGPVIQYAQLLRQPAMIDTGAEFRHRNLSMMPSAYNP